MANSGPDTNGSQFFFTLGPVNRLNYLHTVFGRVVAGLEVLPQIKPGDSMTVRIIRHGAVVEKFAADEASFAKLAASVPRALSAAFEDVSGLLPTDPPRAKTLETKLRNFTRFTGRGLYVRLYGKFEPESPKQTMGQFAADLARKISLPAGDTLLVWFAAENKAQVVAPAGEDLKLNAPTAADLPDPTRRLLATLNEAIDGLIFQLEPKEPVPTGNSR